jgi:hypothetical protein
VTKQSILDFFHIESDNFLSFFEMFKLFFLS